MRLRSREGRFEATRPCPRCSGGPRHRPACDTVAESRAWAAASRTTHGAFDDGPSVPAPLTLIPAERTRFSPPVAHARARPFAEPLTCCVNARCSSWRRPGMSDTSFRERNSRKIVSSSGFPMKSSRLLPSHWLITLITLSVAFVAARSRRSQRVSSEPRLLRYLAAGHVPKAGDLRLLLKVDLELLLAEAWGRHHVIGAARRKEHPPPRQRHPYPKSNAVLRIPTVGLPQSQAPRSGGRRRIYGNQLPHQVDAGHERVVREQECVQERRVWSRPPPRRRPRDGTSAPTGVSLCWAQLQQRKPPLVAPGPSP